MPQNIITMQMQPEDMIQVGNKYKGGEKNDGTVLSLANKSRRPHSHSNQHTEEEIELIRGKYRYHKHEGLGEVYRK